MVKTKVSRGGQAHLCELHQESKDEAGDGRESGAKQRIPQMWLLDLRARSFAEQSGGQKALQVSGPNRSSQLEATLTAGNQQIVTQHQLLVCLRTPTVCVQKGSSPERELQRRECELAW
jgi:hypothetical protein